MKVFNYPDVKQVIISGDIHGNFKGIVHKLCIQYGCTDTLLIVAGTAALVSRNRDTMKTYTIRLPAGSAKQTTTSCSYAATTMIQRISPRSALPTYVGGAYLITALSALGDTASYASEEPRVLTVWAGGRRTKG